MYPYRCPLRVGFHGNTNLTVTTLVHYGNDLEKSLKILSLTGSLEWLSHPWYTMFNERCMQDWLRLTILLWLSQLWPCNSYYERPFDPHAVFKWFIFYFTLCYVFRMAWKVRTYKIWRHNIVLSDMLNIYLYGVYKQRAGLYTYTGQVFEPTPTPTRREPSRPPVGVGGVPALPVPVVAGGGWWVSYASKMFSPAFHTRAPAQGFQIPPIACAKIFCGDDNAQPK